MLMQCQDPFLASLLTSSAQVEESANRSSTGLLEARIDGTLRQQLLNQLASFGGEMSFRDQSNGLMALATPSLAPGTKERADETGKREQQDGERAGALEDSSELREHTTKSSAQTSAPRASTPPHVRQTLQPGL